MWFQLENTFYGWWAIQWTGFLFFLSFFLSFFLFFLSLFLLLFLFFPLFFPPSENLPSLLNNNSIALLFFRRLRAVHGRDLCTHQHTESILAFGGMVASPNSVNINQPSPIRKGNMTEVETHARLITWIWTVSLRSNLVICYLCIREPPSWMKSVSTL